MTSELDEFLYAVMPFMRLIGATAVTATADEVRLRLEWDSSRCTTGDLLHGGALMALADSAGAWCAFMNVPEGASTTTIESKTNFLRGVRDRYVEAVARPLHVGRTTVVIDTELRDADDRLVARTTQTQAVLT